MQTLFGFFYGFFEHHLKDLCEYIDKNIANEFIYSLKCSTVILILFAFKSNYTLQLGVN